MGRLFELAVVLGDLMERGLAERRLSRARATVIWQLHERGAVVQRELSQALGVTPRNVTGLVDALEAAGLVARQAHPTDRRATLVSLTEPGKTLAAELHADQQRFGALLFDRVPAAELASFMTTLDHVLARLHELASGTSESQDST